VEQDPEQVHDATMADVETATAASPAAIPDDDLIEMESLVEEVSIDGMCGVY
jgi:mycofactocin precursor